MRSTTSEHDSRGNLRIEPGAAQFFANERKHFMRARLRNFGKHARVNRARRPVADTRNFNSYVLVGELAKHAGVLALELFRFGDRSAQAHGEIVGKMIAPYG